VSADKLFILKAKTLIACNAGRAVAGQEFIADADSAAWWLRHGQARLVDPDDVQALFAELQRLNARRQAAARWAA
jgi:hypothetical protein